MKTATISQTQIAASLRQFLTPKLWKRAESQRGARNNIPSLMKEESLNSVNPSLWRIAQLNCRHGLFKVTDGVYQIRGFDIANMTIVEGRTGIIVVDTLTCAKFARAALDLYLTYRGKRPVKAVIYTHTHADHFGGVKGVVNEADVASGAIPIIAPNLFMEHAVSENVIAGPAMLRRSMYQFGPLLPAGPRGQVDAGLGKTTARGTLTLIAPTDLIMATGDRRVIDEIEFIFQMAPNTEAPAEMHMFVAEYRTLNLAENATHLFHNLLPFRGAEVRDPTAWADTSTKQSNSSALGPKCSSANITGPSGVVSAFAIISRSNVICINTCMTRRYG